MNTTLISHMEKRQKFGEKVDLDDYGFVSSSNLSDENRQPYCHECWTVQCVQRGYRHYLDDEDNVRTEEYWECLHCGN